jgi:hypothetical protein
MPSTLRPQGLVNWKKKKKKKKKKNKTRPLADSNSEGKTGLKALVASDEHLPMVTSQLVRIVVLPTSRSAVRIAGPVDVALSLELVEKSRKAGHQEIYTSRALSSINFKYFFFFQTTVNAQ